MLATALLLSTLASAEEGKPLPPVKVGALVFAHYGYDLSAGADGFNEFALDRAYLDAKGQVRDDLGGRVTLDADRLKSTDADGNPVDTKYRFYIKYAYAEWKAPAGIKVRGGVVDTGYVGFYDGFWGQRFVSKAMADELKVLDSADIGINVQGTQAGGMLDWHLALVNGEGYGKPEAAGGKAGQARLTVDPLAKGGAASLPITAFASYAGPDPTGGDAVISYAGAVGFKMPYVLAWGEVLGQQEGATRALGWSATALPGIPDVGGVILRYDRLDADVSAEGGVTDRMIGGLTHSFADKVAVAATFERTLEDGEAEQGAFLRMQAGF